MHDDESEGGDSRVRDLMYEYGMFSSRTPRQAVPSLLALRNLQLTTYNALLPLTFDLRSLTLDL